MPVNDDELLARADAKRLRSCRHVVLTVEEYDALRAALAARPQPDPRDAEIDRLRHALTNVADNLHGAGLISDVAKADILRAAAGSATPTTEQAWVDDALAMFDEGTATKRAGSATPIGDNDG